MHVSLLCLVPHLLAAAPVRHWSRARIAFAPIAVVAWLMGPLGVADLLSGASKLHQGADGHYAAWVGDWLSTMRERTPTTQAFVWGVYLSAWCVPAVICVRPGTARRNGA